MKKLLIFREKVRSLVEQHGKAIRNASRFILTFIVLSCMDATFGEIAILSRLSVHLLLSFGCVFIPPSYCATVVAILVAIHSYRFSADIAMLYLGASIIIGILYKKNFVKYGYMMPLSMILVSHPLSAFSSIFAGIFAGPGALVPMIAGILTHYYGVSLNEIMLKLSSDIGTYQVYQQVIDHMLLNKEILLCLISSGLTLLVAWKLFNSKINYAWQISIPVAGIVYVIAYLYGSFLLNLETSSIQMIGMTIIVVLILEVFQFFRGILDYSRAELLQYEDDEYYYYVKAVPKIKISEQKIDIQTINIQRKGLIRRREKKDQ